MAITPVRREAGGRVELRVDAVNLAAVKEQEELLTSDTAAAPCIDFSTGASWKEIARAYAAVTDSLLDEAPLGGYLNGIAGAAGMKKPDLIAAILYRVRKDVRYTGINFGENAIIPHPPLDTLTRGYGDCKDQSVLLAAALRAGGIDAKLALLMAGDGLDVSSQLPGFGLFNHAIVYLPREGMWIDPTADFSLPGDLPLMDQGRRALIITPATTSLSLTPDPPPSSNWFREVREFRLAESGPATVVETSTMAGSFAVFYRDSFERSSASEAHDHLEKYVKREYNASSLARFTASDPRAMDVPFTMTVEASEAKEGTTDDSSAVVHVRGGSLLDFLPQFITREDAPGTAFTRINDMRLWEPFVCEYTYRIIAPPGYSAAALPPDETVPLGPAVLTKVFTLNADGSVTAVLRVDCVKRVYTAAETIAMHQAVRAFLDGQASIVSFEQVGESLLAAGKYRESLAEFRALAALHPAEAYHRVQISRALLAAGFGGDALKEARRAVDLQSELALPHGNLAWTLLHDEFGRLFARGIDLAGARAEYERARKLEPANSMYARNLAILDEYNDSLVRYGSGAKLDEAIALYRSIEKDIKDSDYWPNLSFDLLYAGRFQDVKTTLRDGASTSTLQALYVAASAALDGAAAAQKEAARLVASAEDRRKVLGSAAQYLLNARQYPQSAELMIAGARGTANLTQTIALADLLKTLTPSDPKLLRDSSPQGIILMLMSLLLRGEGTTPAFESLMASSIRSALADPGERAEATGTLESIRGELSQLPFPSDTMFDLLTRFISIQSIVEDGATAALMSMPAFPAYTPMVFYLSKEAGAYRFVDATGDLSGIARECLAHLDAGRLDEARAWIHLIRTQHARSAAFPDTASDPLFTLLPADGAAGADALRLAAGFALSRSKSPADARQGVSFVLPLWRAEKDAGRRLTIETTLAEGLLLAGRMKDLQEVAASFVKDAPADLRGLELLCIAMEQAGMTAEAEALIRARLAAKPGDLGLSRLLEENLAGAGRYEEAIAVAGAILDSGATKLSDYNNFAWYSLYTGVIDPAVVEKRQIVQRLVQGNSAELHTLACVLADEGRILEAQEVFGKYLEQRGGALPDSSTWLAYGMLAQRFGLIDTARAAFAKVTQEGPESLSPGISSWTLAQMHLKEAQASKAK
jgi:tetratricopeptide (TPR) repeat protein